MNIKFTSASTNTVELKKILNDKGITTDIIYIDGKPFANVGYTSEADRVALIDAVKTAIACSASIDEAKKKLCNCCELGYFDINPDEEIKVDGIPYPVMIDYGNGTAYIGTVKVADLAAAGFGTPDGNHARNDLVKNLLSALALTWYAKNGDEAILKGASVSATGMTTVPVDTRITVDVDGIPGGIKVDVDAGVGYYKDKAIVDLEKMGLGKPGKGDKKSDDLVINLVKALAAAWYAKNR